MSPIVVAVGVETRTEVISISLEPSLSPNSFRAIAGVKERPTLESTRDVANESGLWVISLSEVALDVLKETAQETWIRTQKGEKGFNRDVVD